MPPASGAPRPPLPRTVKLLGWVSLFADISSEMAYPLVPLLLTGALGAPKSVVGLIEGLAEASVAFSNYFAGRASDRVGRLGFLRIGYLLPPIGKTIVASAAAWPMVLGGRMVDRLGKGVRSSPRDALLVEDVAAGDRGRALGLHRAMDTAGAVIGVLGAVAILYAFRDTHAPESLLRRMILLSAVLGLAAFALTFFVKERPVPNRSARGPSSPLSRSYWLAVIPLVLFGFASSSDAFLLLRCSDFGLPPWGVALSYACYSMMAAMVAYPIGALSDRIGRRPVIITGFLLYAATYAGFALIDAAWMAWPLLTLYGVSIACTDGVGKALIADRSPPESRGKALGTMQMLVGLATLGGSLGAGLLWDHSGPSAAMWLGSVMAVVATIALMVLWRPTAAIRAG